jgi:hypothetical protein
MDHAKVFGRYALTGAVVLGGFTIASLATFNAIGVCSHALSFLH